MIQEPSAKGWLSVVLATLRRDKLIWAVVTLCVIWYARRKAVLEDIF
jgi:hypothetical protein